MLWSLLFICFKLPSFDNHHLPKLPKISILLSKMLENISQCGWPCCCGMIILCRLGAWLKTGRSMPAQTDQFLCVYHQLTGWLPDLIWMLHSWAPEQWWPHTNTSWLFECLYGTWRDLAYMQPLTTGKFTYTSFKTIFTGEITRGLQNLIL